MPGECPKWAGQLDRNKGAVLLGSLRLRGQQRARYEFCVHVFGQFLEFAVRDAANPAVAIVVGPPCLRGDATAGLDRDVVAFGDDPVQHIRVSVRELREQGSQQLRPDRLLAAIRPGPRGRADDRPAKILGQSVVEEPAVTNRKAGENVLKKLLVLDRAHDALLKALSPRCRKLL